MQLAEILLTHDALSVWDVEIRSLPTCFVRPLPMGGAAEQAGPTRAVREGQRPMTPAAPGTIR